MSERGTYIYDWVTRRTNDPSFPECKLAGVPFTKVMLNGSEFDRPVARCYSGENGLIEYLVQEPDRTFRLAEDRRPMHRIARGHVEVVAMKQGSEDE